MQERRNIKQTKKTTKQKGETKSKKRKNTL